MSGADEMDIPAAVNLTLRYFDRPYTKSPPFYRGLLRILVLTL